MTSSARSSRSLARFYSGRMRCSLRCRVPLQFGRRCSGRHLREDHVRQVALPVPTRNLVTTPLVEVALDVE
jgi:hypothetical protein